MSPRCKKETILEKCDIIETIGVMGGRYKLLIVRVLLYRGEPTRFGNCNAKSPKSARKPSPETCANWKPVA